MIITQIPTLGPSPACGGGKIIEKSDSQGLRTLSVAFFLL
jgi:hypothetical protein